MAAVIAVGGLAPQGRALDRLAGGSTWQGRGVQQPEPIAPRRRADRQVSQREHHQVSGSAQALVVAGLAGQIREQVAQPVMGEPQPVALGAGAQQHLGNGQADQLSVAELWRAAWAEPWTNQLVDGDVQCGDEVVETGVHEASLEVDVARATPTLGDLASLVTAQHHRPDSESIV